MCQMRCWDVPGASAVVLRSHGMHAFHWLSRSRDAEATLTTMRDTPIQRFSMLLLGLILLGSCADDRGSTAPPPVPPPRTGRRIFLDIPRINAAWNVDIVVVEGQRDVRWRATRSDAVGEASADLVVRPGTAQNGSDYYSDGWMAWFADGTASSNEETSYGWPGLGILDDDLVEPDEDVVLQLTDPDSGWALDPVRDRIFVTIVDDDDVPPVAAAFTWPMEVGESSHYEASGGGSASDGSAGGFVVHHAGSISIPTQRVFKGETYAVFQGLTGEVLMRQEGSRIYVVPRGTLGDPPPADDPKERRLWERMPWLWFDAADPARPYTASFSDSSVRYPDFSYSVRNHGTTRIAIPSGIFRVQCLEIGWTASTGICTGEGKQLWYIADSIGVVALENQDSEHCMPLGIYRRRLDGGAGRRAAPAGAWG